MASLKDIASDLGISISLASKVLNNRLGNTGVSPELAEAIRVKAKELNYHKNVAALSLRKGCHDTVGVFLHRHGEPGSGLLERLIIGISEIAEQESMRLILAFFETPEEFIKLSKTANRGSMDGLIVGGLPHKELADTAYQIQQQGLPVVTIQNIPMHPDIPNIGMPESDIGRVATEHLIAQGCKRIGHIRFLASRCEGYQQAMQEAGLEIHPEWIFEANDPLAFSIGTGEHFAKKILQEGLELDGVVAESDQQALGLLNTFQASGVRIPEEMKVIGVDNSSFCQYQPIQLSTVSQKTGTKGRMAMKKILKLRANETVGSLTIPPELLIRRSSGGA